jgi:hypothetical protein
MRILAILAAIFLLQQTTQEPEVVFALPGPAVGKPCARGYADTETGWAQQFILLNTMYFGGRLPRTTRIMSSEVVDEGNIAETTWENSDPKRPIVKIVPSKNATWNAARMSLIHELIHVALGPNVDDSHGPKFKRELRRLVLAGALDDSF